MAGLNTLARRLAPKAIFVDAKPVLDDSVSFNQGDLLIYDVAEGLIRKPTVETEGETFLGIAVVTIVDGRPAGAYTTDVDESASIISVPGPEYGDVHRVILKAGDSIEPGAAVYLDPASGPRFVSVEGTKAIGIYQGPSLTAATGGTQIEVLIGARYSEDVLKF